MSTAGVQESFSWRDTDVLHNLRFLTADGRELEIEYYTEIDTDGSLAILGRFLRGNTNFRFRCVVAPDFPSSAELATPQDDFDVKPELESEFDRGLARAAKVAADREDERIYFESHGDRRPASPSSATQMTLPDPSRFM